MYCVLAGELPDHHGVAFADVAHQLTQTKAVIARPGHSVAECLCDPCPVECLMLLVEGLGCFINAVNAVFATGISETNI